MQPQIIYNGNNQPAYAVIPWQDYQRLAALDDDDNEVIPFDVANYIDNSIKAARIKANWTQTQLADALGVKQSYIAKIEGRTYKPTSTLLARVTSALSV
jgi:DNA-binding XRE family transcriptional regulator